MVVTAVGERAFKSRRRRSAGVRGRGSVGRVLDRQANDAQQAHAATVGAQHLETETLVQQFLAAPRHVPEFARHQAADGVDVLRGLPRQFEELGELLESRTRLDRLKAKKKKSWFTI